MNDFLERLKFLMVRDGTKSQYQLSKKIGVKPGIVSNWFRRKAQYPSEGNLMKLAELFRVHPSWLKYGEKQFKPDLTDEAMKVAEKLKYSTPEIIAKVSKIIDILNEPIIKPPTYIFYRADAKTFRTTYISESVQQLLGYSAKEWLEDPDLWFKSLHPSDKQRVINKLDEAQKKGTNIVYRYRIKRRDGTFINIEDYTSWEKDFKDTIVSVEGFICPLKESNSTDTDIEDKSEFKRDN
jgi:transcriptional regulator with XRE-family HTH domain